MAGHAPGVAFKLKNNTCIEAIGNGLASSSITDGNDNDGFPSDLGIIWPN
jgi:hypothetical protein